ncbi:DnaA ATPase domain-containing protein [Alkalimonas mucilaginosa]|uniref:DnaA/Hda family protein n=1 Tax=Alkalimonas mucilaginosa TaxID=3057676 RepID=A0ABU7JGS7_9GAMM|nr:DnaA/Hda family protein [Alkalimonas sp. MEB004]MEE2024879.1 DnaA/Hda family protein [Alkalimonas sp. MEB004]
MSMKQNGRGMMTDSLLHANKTINNLVRCEYNDNAMSTALRFIAEPASSQLTIDSQHGNGDGMTHLLLGLGHELVSSNTDTWVITAERMLYRHSKELLDWKKLFDVDWLLIDDINFLFGKPDKLTHPLVEMLALRNKAGKKTIFTVAIEVGAQPQCLPDKYLELLYSGEVSRLELPSQADKLKIARAMCQQLDYIPEIKMLTRMVNDAGNIRQLEGLLSRYNAQQGWSLHGF